MARFLFRRLVYTSVMVVAITIFVFGMSRLAGDPRNIYLAQDTPVALWEQWGTEMGLDRPLVVQYLIWAKRTMRGDLGDSLRYKRNALDPVMARLPATIQLAATAWMFSLLVGIPLGVLSATQRGTILDSAVRSLASVGQAIPAFWLGLVLILLFAVQLHLLPTGTRGGIRHLILPAITLGTNATAGMLRLVRSSMLDVLDSEYIKLARIKGVGRWAVVWKHALRNAMITPLTYAGLLLAAFFTGAVVVETVFSWPGIGRLAVESIFLNDFPLLSAVVLLFTLLYVGVNLMVDIAYVFVDPRLRLR